MRLSDWEEIAITDTDEVRLRQYHLSTWSLVSEKLRIIRSTGANSVAARRLVDVWFVSGSRDFLAEFGKLGLSPAIYWIERCGRRRPQDTSECSWFTVSHERVGGSTTARGVFGRRSLDDLSIEVDPLRRTISHIVKFAIRPVPCSVLCVEHHYLISQRLCLSRLHQPVVYETCFSRTASEGAKYCK